MRFRCHQVSAERSRLAWLSKFEVVKRNHRVQRHKVRAAAGQAMAIPGAIETPYCLLTAGCLLLPNEQTNTCFVLSHKHLSRRHQKWEVALDASEAKMRKLQGQLVKKQELFQQVRDDCWPNSPHHAVLIVHIAEMDCLGRQKRDIINDYNLKSEREEKVRERLKRPNSAPGLDGTCED
eukprot:SAG22_NODE_1182_length_5233_cov_12.254188_3_plen_179_part_00